MKPPVCPVLLGNRLPQPLTLNFNRSSAEGVGCGTDITPVDCSSSLANPAAFDASGKMCSVFPLGMNIHFAEGGTNDAPLTPSGSAQGESPWADGSTRAAAPGREPPGCPPFSIRAHILSLLTSYLEKRKNTRPLNASAKYGKIDIYKDGVLLTAPRVGGSNDQSGKHKRGEIAGWSRSSRRRMRDFMLRYAVPDGWTACGVTFTIPGYPLPLSEVKRLWQNWTVRANRLPLCAVWRIEIQKRGQLHWHLIVGYNDSAKEAQAAIKESWHKALRSLGILEYCFVGNPADPYEVDWVSGRCNPMDFNGAEWYSAKVDVFPDTFGPWKRYLQDHATKSKQEQIPYNIGRHWGKINGKAFVEVFPVRASTLTNKEYSRFLRAYNRLCTPYIKCDGALFGRVRGYTANRGRWGKSVFYSMPETVGRLMDWALTENNERLNLINDKVYENNTTSKG